MIKTEALCLTKFMNHSDMKEWLEWHLDSVGFDHIHVINNDSKFDLESLCLSFKDKVSYEEIHYHPRQYKLYDFYINNVSKSDWIMPIDDDEYLEISKEFSSVTDVISYYKEQMPDMEMLAVRWKHLFPSKFKTERTGKVLEYCTREHQTLASTFQREGDRGVKALVHRSGKIHYQETCEIPNGGHIPLHEKAEFAYGFDGRKVTGNYFTEFPRDVSNEKIRLIHCRYKGFSDYTEKYILNGAMTVSDKNPRKKQFVFNMLLPSLD